MTLYLKHCSICKKKTPNRISFVRRNKGAKLQCLCCGKINLRFYNILKLIETTFEEFQNEKT